MGRSKTNDKLRNIITNMPEEHRVLIFGDSFRSKMQSLDDEKAALLTVKRQFLPLQSRIENKRIMLSAKAFLFLLVLVGQGFLVGLVEKKHIPQNTCHPRSLRYKRLLSRLSLMVSLESRRCRVLRTSADRDATGRRGNASPRPAREPNRKRIANLMHSLQSATKPPS